MSEAVNALMLSSQSSCERGWVPAAPGTAFRVSLPAAGAHEQHCPNFDLDSVAFMGWPCPGVVEPLVNTELVFTRWRGKIGNDAGVALIIKQLLGDIVSLLALEPGPQIPSICFDKTAWHCVADHGSALVLSAPIETTPPEAAAAS